jgi:UDP-N-acetylglucosamine/UDP-N-acetylgalactosamine diphosphorylase
VVVSVDGSPRVIEYSDLPAELAERREPDGSLELWAGSIAIHLMEREFIERLVVGLHLPFHRAIKKVPHLDDSGRPVRPTEPNAVKFEQFIFDALPAGEPVDAGRDRSRRRVRAAEERDGAGLARDRPPADERPLRRLARRGRGHRPAPARRLGALRIEISPLLALDAEELKAKIAPGLVVEGPLYLR